MSPVPTVIVITALVTAPACGEENPMQSPVQEVKRRHEAELMAVEGVVSVGIGRDQDGQDVIVVGVEGDRPEIRRLPERLDGYALRVEVVGRIRSR